MALPPNVRGLAELNRALQKLSKEEATKAGQAAIRGGAGVLRKATIAAAPDSPRTTEGEKRTRHTKGGGTRTEVHGKIKNNVVVRKTKSTSPTEVQSTVGIRSNAYHASFVQFGSIHNAADPFMLNALKASEDNIMTGIAKTLNKQLIKRGV